jgi:hypothetical protein
MKQLPSQNPGKPHTKTKQKRYPFGTLMTIISNPQIHSVKTSISEVEQCRTVNRDIE